jgi:hypothetical protein
MIIMHALKLYVMLSEILIYLNVLHCMALGSMIFLVVWFVCNLFNNVELPVVVG